MASIRGRRPARVSEARSPGGGSHWALMVQTRSVRFIRPLRQTVRTPSTASINSVDGVIDLERPRSGSSTSPERGAARFLELTWPSSDVRPLVRGLSNRFNDGSQSGTILAHAAKGLGKSHALLLGYHLFSSPEIVRAWAKSLG